MNSFDNSQHFCCVYHRHLHFYLLACTHSSLLSFETFSECEMEFFFRSRFAAYLYTLNAMLFRQQKKNDNFFGWLVSTQQLWLGIVYHSKSTQPTRLLLARNTFALLLYQQHINNFNYPNEFHVRTEIKWNEMEWNETESKTEQSIYTNRPANKHTHNAEQMEINQIDMKQKKKENNYKLRF